MVSSLAGFQPLLLRSQLIALPLSKQIFPLELCSIELSSVNEKDWYLISRIDQSEIWITYSTQKLFNFTLSAITQ